MFRSYSNDVTSERSTLRTVFRDTFRSRAISLIVLPLRKCSRRIRPIVSTAQVRLARAQWRKLFKLHGALDNPHTLAARDYKRWAERHPVAHHFVKDLPASIDHLSRNSMFLHLVTGAIGRP
jgi:hypothetical protein